MTSSGPQLRRRRLGVVHIVFFTRGGLGAADRARRRRDDDVRRHRRHRRAAVVPHPRRGPRAVRGRLRGDEPLRRQRGRLLLLPRPRARRHVGRRRGVRRRRLLQRDPDRPLRAVRGRARRLGQPDDGVSAAVVGVGPRRADHRRAARREPRRPQRQRARRAVGPGVHRGACSTTSARSATPPRAARVRGRVVAVVAVRAGCRRGLRVRRRRVHRLRVGRDLQRGGPQPAGHGGQGHLHRRRVHRAVLRRVVVGHARHRRRRRPPEADRRRTGPASCSRASAEHWGDGVATIANLLFLTSVLRRAAELPQRRGPLPVRARPRAGAAGRAQPGRHPVGRPGRGLAGAERAAPSSSWRCSRCRGPTRCCRCSPGCPASRRSA